MWKTAAKRDVPHMGHHVWPSHSIGHADTPEEGRHSRQPPPPRSPTASALVNISTLIEAQMSSTANFTANMINPTQSRHCIFLGKTSQLHKSHRAAAPSLNSHWIHLQQNSHWPSYFAFCVKTASQRAVSVHAARRLAACAHLLPGCWSFTQHDFLSAPVTYDWNTCTQWHVWGLWMKQMCWWISVFNHAFHSLKSVWSYQWILTSMFWLDSCCVVWMTNYLKVLYYAEVFLFFFSNVDNNNDRVALTCQCFFFFAYFCSPFLS